VLADNVYQGINVDWFANDSDRAKARRGSRIKRAAMTITGSVASRGGFSIAARN
jgi:hypothetical protein